MRNKLTYLYAALLAVGITACQDDVAPDEGNGAGKTPLAIRAFTRSGEGENIDETVYKAFNAGQQIRVYYAHNNLEQTYDFLQGIYEAPGGDNKDANWIPQEWKPSAESESVKSIYIEDIKSPNSDNKYFFTATSYPEPLAANASEGIYEVPLDQTNADINKYDFLAARAIYSDYSWKEQGKGITLHFRHLLSQLRVQLVLPKGTTNDGYFPDPENAKIDATLIGKIYQYNVTYDNRIEAGGIFGITPNSNSGDMKMRPGGQVQATTVNGRKAYLHTFSVILPRQNFSAGKLIQFTINGKSYSYTSPDANTVVLDQEKITTIRLTVLSGPGNQKVILNQVTMEDWKEDKADVGTLIPQ